MGSAGRAPRRGEPAGTAVRAGAKTRVAIHTVHAGASAPRTDVVVTEEPLEIRLVAGGETRTVAVTMRTPGHDFELAAGFLFGEGVLRDPHEIARMSYCADPEVDREQQYNIVNVALRSPVLPALATLERHFYTTSACGVCGKATLEALRLRGLAHVRGGLVVDAGTLAALPGTLRRAQSLFAATGGLHAAALFDRGGRLVALREDVGRHNAMDKLVGWAWLEGRVPLDLHVVMVSGRASFELVQKAVAAGIPVFCAVSAPSSLAVDTAREFGVSLVGFLRGEQFNVYSGAERVRVHAPDRGGARH
jgi:FdhD protein